MGSLRRAFLHVADVAVLAVQVNWTKCQDGCRACGLLLTTVLDFRAHHQAVAHRATHVQTLWSLLGIDYAALQAEEKAEARADAEQRARERGWELL